MKITRIAVILLLGILLVSGVVCCEFETTGPEFQPGEADVQILTQDLICETHTWSDYCKCHITGTVKNFGDADASGVMIEAEFYDIHGIRLDTGHDFIGDLRAGQSAYYEVLYYGEQGKQCPNDYEIWVEWWEY